MENADNYMYGLLLLCAALLFAFLHWLVKNFKLKHIWTVHAGLGLLSGFLIMIALHAQLPDGEMRQLLVGDAGRFVWPFTIQNLMWMVFAITIWMLLAEGKLAKMDNDSDIVNLDAHIDGRLEPVRFLIWLIPTLGFLGTIVGMSFAIQELASSEDLLADLEGGLLSNVMTSLGTAFYTTILGLIMNAVCYGMMSVHAFQHKQTLSNRK